MKINSNTIHLNIIMLVTLTFCGEDIVKQDIHHHLTVKQLLVTLIGLVWYFSFCKRMLTN